MNVRIALLAACCALFSCNAPRRSVHPGATADSQAKALSTAQSAAPLASSSSPPPAIEPVSLRTTRLAALGFEVALHNAGAAAIELEDELVVERREGPIWLESGYRVTLVKRCGGGPPACVSIATGETLSFPAWTGMSCDPRCPCRANAMASPGEYRFVARRCGGGTRVEGEPFLVP